jgi:phosphate transport system protein
MGGNLTNTEMTTVLEDKIAGLRQQLFTMAGIVEEMIGNSVRALVAKDSALADQVIGPDEDRVNRLEIENEDAAINLVALYQPEASNLRAVAMIIKMNNDLERLGDHAVNIAQAAQFLMTKPAVKPLVDIPKMADYAIGMLKDSLDAFTRNDAELARSVCGRDNTVDELNNTVKRDLARVMSTDADTIDRALKLMMVSLNLERIADLATNIAEDVIYIATGKVIKHHCKDEGPNPDH